MDTRCVYLSFCIGCALAFLLYEGNPPAPIAKIPQPHDSSLVDLGELGKLSVVFWTEYLEFALTKWETLSPQRKREETTNALTLLEMHPSAARLFGYTQLSGELSVHPIFVISLCGFCGKACQTSPNHVSIKRWGAFTELVSREWTTRSPEVKAMIDAYITTLTLRFGSRCLQSAVDCPSV